MSRAEAEIVLGTALMTAALCGVVWLVAAVWVALDEHRGATIEIRVDPAAWLISQVHEDARRIITEAAAERKELP